MPQSPRTPGPPIQAARRRAGPQQPLDTAGPAVPPPKPPSRRTPPCTPLGTSFRQLKATRRGKHVGGLSYYHRSLIDRVPPVASELASICSRLHGADFAFNVVKLDAGCRISFLCYQSFTTAFPALLAALTCDLNRATARHTDYATRLNPPILHRKELLLPADHPLVPDAERLTDRLQQLGAFHDTRRIGTRAGWARRLASLGIGPDGGPV